MLPVAADERLEEEQKAVREFRERLANVQRRFARSK